jgi:DNA-binding LytR/AlgR family response regulator
MTALRILICDDEPLAVRRLGSMLARLPDAGAVATAQSGREALDLIAAGDFDLALLDVEMPEIDGFDVVAEMGAAIEGARDVPLVAFVTAFRRFAPEAFDSGAIDFLSKPVRLARLERALQRARDAIAGREACRRLIDLQATLDRLRGPHDPYREAHVWVRRRGENVRIDLDQVERVAAEGAYVRLHVDSTSFLHREVIGAIEPRFDPARFMRVHRSHLIRTSNVSAVLRTVYGAAELVLRDGQHIPVGRKYAKEVRRRLRAGGWDDRPD